MENKKVKYFINLTFLNDIKFNSLPKEASPIDRQLYNYRNSLNDEFMELLLQLEPKQASSTPSIKLMFDNIQQELLRNLTPKELVLFIAYFAYPVGAEGKLEQILKKLPSLYLMLSDNKISLQTQDIIANSEYISSILRNSLSFCVKDGWLMVDIVFYKVLELELSSIIKQFIIFFAVNSKNSATMTGETKLLIDSVKSSQASKGGQTKAENYRAKMNPIFDKLFNLYQNSHPITAKKWKSKSECAKYFIKEFYLENPETEIDLDPKKLVAEITNRINDRAASRNVTLLADR